MSGTASQRDTQDHVAVKGPFLIVFGRLPGTGKTTISQALAADFSASYVRVDEIEHALRRGPDSGADIGTAGYRVAFAIAASNLRLGNIVVADSVNPVPESRLAWREVTRGIEAGLRVDTAIVSARYAVRHITAEMATLSGSR